MNIVDFRANAHLSVVNPQKSVVADSPQVPMVTPAPGLGRWDNSPRNTNSGPSLHHDT